MAMFVIMIVLKLLVLQKVKILKNYRFILKKNLKFIYKIKKNSIA